MPRRTNSRLSRLADKAAAYRARRSESAPAPTPPAQAHALEPAVECNIQWPAAQDVAACNRVLAACDAAVKEGRVG